MNVAAVSICLSVATLIVVGVASAAAIVQLRHLRSSNQLSALLEIMNQWNLPAVQSAMAELRAIRTRMDDPKYVEALKTSGTVDRATHPAFLALDFWEQIGTFSKHRLVDENILLDIVSAQVANAWACGEPAIMLVRERAGPSAFENFEYLAVRAELWSRKHPNGAYPVGLPRMRNL